MPLGSSKISLGGADLVPGGNSTFNSSGTFVAPLGVSLVCAPGRRKHPGFGTGRARPDRPLPGLSISE